MFGGALEAVCVATYAEDYLEAIESSPGFIQPHVSAIRNLDIQYQSIITEIKAIKSELPEQESGGGEAARRKLFGKLKVLLAQGQLNGDAKLRELAHIQEIVEAKSRQLDNDIKNFEPHKSKEDRYHSKSGILIGGGNRSGGYSGSFAAQSSSDLVPTSSGSAAAKSESRAGVGSPPLRGRQQKLKVYPDFVRDPDLPPPAKKAARVE